MEREALKLSLRRRISAVFKSGSGSFRASFRRSTADRRSQAAGQSVLQRAESEDPWEAEDPDDENYTTILGADDPIREIDRAEQRRRDAAERRRLERAQKDAKRRDLGAALDSRISFLRRRSVKSSAPPTTAEGMRIIQKILLKNMSKVSTLFAEYDVDNSGFLDRDEFYTLGVCKEHAEHRARLVHASRVPFESLLTHVRVRVCVCVCVCVCRARAPLATSVTTVTQHKVTTFKVSREWTDAIFDEIDQDRNGEVSERELKLLLRAGRPDPNASFRKTSRIVRASLMIGGSGGKSPKPQADAPNVTMTKVQAFSVDGDDDT